MKHDSVESPTHYTDGGIETIDFIKAKVQCFESYCLGNTIKYVSRAGKKNDKVEDLRKAAIYLKWAIDDAEDSGMVIRPEGSD